MVWLMVTLLVVVGTLISEMQQNITVQLNVFLTMHHELTIH